MPVDLKKKKRGTAVSKNEFIHPPTHTLVSMPIIQNQKYQSPVAPNITSETGKNVFLNISDFTFPPNRGEIDCWLATRD